VGGIKGSVLRTLKVFFYIAALIALAVLAFPISTAAAQPTEEPLVFVIDTNLSKPVMGPHIEAVKVAKPVKVKTALAFDPCNCMSYVKYKTGGHTVRGVGYARNHPVNSSTCTVGAIIVTYESRMGHVGIVNKCDEKFVTIDDYNYNHCKPSIRPLALNSPLIKGYYTYAN
jgi:hypothetical protein